jgi:hypothetical protein
VNNEQSKCSSRILRELYRADRYVSYMMGIE